MQMLANPTDTADELAAHDFHVSNFVGGVID